MSQEPERALSTGRGTDRRLGEGQGEEAKQTETALWRPRPLRDSRSRLDQ